MHIHPSSQPIWVTFVSVDFSTESFIGKLTSAGFDAKEPRRLVLMEALFYYLEQGAVMSTLQLLAMLYTRDV